MDDADRAQAINERELADLLVRRRVHPPLVAQISCVDCGDEIPPARRAAVPRATRCLYCQQEVELNEL